MQGLKFLAIAIVGALLLGIGILYSGMFNVAADEPHWTITASLLGAMRERSIAAQALRIKSPLLEDQQLIATGAEHYAEMCTGCHSAPGETDTELRQGLYPRPPSLVAQRAQRSPEQTFWIIKHGLKMTAMPAWGVTHDDQIIWAMVAFLRKLPSLSAENYREILERGAGEHAAGEHVHPHESGERSYSTANSHDTEKNSALAHTGALTAVLADPASKVAAFSTALAAGDTAAAAQLLDPAVLIFESGGAERSREEYMSHHLAADAAFLKTVHTRLLSRTGDAVGDLAWVASETRLTGSASKAINLRSTETMILRKRAAGWRIVHIHWSSANEAASK